VGKAPVNLGDINIAPYVMSIIGAFIWLAYNRIQSDIKEVKANTMERSARNEQRIIEVERAISSAVSSTTAAVSELKTFMREQLSTLRLELVQGHPTKAELEMALGAKNSRLDKIENILAENQVTLHRLLLILDSGTLIKPPAKKSSV